MDNVLEINNLDFIAPDVACAVKSTKRTKTFAYPTQYLNCRGNERIEFLFNTGTYIDPAKSSLTLRLRVNAPIPQTENDLSVFQFDYNEYQNSGASILNLISEISHESKDGSLMYKQNYVNIMQTTREYIISNEYKNNVMTLVGGISPDDLVYGYEAYAINADVNFNIPLTLLSDFFNTRAMMHPTLLSGSKLTLILANPRLNIVGYNSQVVPVPGVFPEGTTIDITNLSLNLQQCELYDGIQAVIKSSLLNSIKYPFYNVYNSKYEPTSTSFTFNVQFAASVITYVAVKFFPKIPQSPMASASIRQLSANQINYDDNSLSFSIRARLNGKAYPTYNITTATQAYLSTIQALNPISHSDTQDIDPLRNINHLGSGCVPYSNYCLRTSTETGTAKGGFIVAFSLEKNRDIGLSGEATTASKTVSIEVEDFTNYDQFDMYVQLQYLSVASIHENNVIISK